MGEALLAEDGVVTRSAEYVGSFPVEDRSLDEQMEQLNLQLRSLKTLPMAPALHRVSLSTSRPAEAQFPFVSRNPGSADAQIYCHVFRARHVRAVE